MASAYLSRVMRRVPTRDARRAARVLARAVALGGAIVAAAVFAADSPSSSAAGSSASATHGAGPTPRLSAGATGAEALPRIDPALAAALDEARAGERLSVIAVLRDQLPAQELDAIVAETARDAGSHASSDGDISDSDRARAARRTRIASRLRAHALATQAPLAAALRAASATDATASIASPDASDAVIVRPLWIANALGVEAPPAVIRALARRGEIASLSLAIERPVFESGAVRGRRSGPREGGTWRPRLEVPEARHPGAVDWGVAKMDAPRVWREFGLDGTGVVVAVIDAGVCFEHPDIASRIWVNPGEDLDGDGAPRDADDLNGIDDDGNGYVDDLAGWDFTTAPGAPPGDPGDDRSGHGSHCAGTVAGDGSAGFRAGMAPGAKVMVLRAGLSTANELSVWRAIEYAAANGAHVISLSLGWRHAWGPDRATWRRVVEAATAMGTIVVVAAGNDGYGGEPDNVRTPADVPAAIAVGATDEGDRVAVFSARGPVTWSGVEGYDDHPYPPGLLKPDVVAPGVSTRSHARCEGYADSTGTSMAAPHVAGALALAIEADPTLDVARARSLLAETAVDVGERGADVDSGAGRVDAYRAVRAVRSVVEVVEWAVDEPPDGGGAADEAGGAGGGGAGRTGDGDGDGALEPGETAALRVVFENRGPAGAGEGGVARDVVAELVAEGAGVAVLLPRVSLGDLPPGARATATFVVRASGACGARIAMRTDATDREGRRGRGRFAIDLGRVREGVLFADDAESDRGWRVKGDAAAGAWVRAVPVGTRAPDGAWANPPADASEGGTHAFVTGNGGGAAAEDDVDGGETWLVSPELDAARWRGLRLEVSRWLHRAGRARVPADEGLVLEISVDGGETWRLADAMLAATDGWERTVVQLEDLVPPGTSLILRARAFDIGTANGGAARVDSLVEAGLDDIVLSGNELVCE